MPMLCARTFLAVFIALFAPVGTAASAADSVTLSKVQEDLRAANEARSRQGAEIQAWRLESDRLAATVDGLKAELARAQADLAQVESARDALKTEQDRLGAGDVAAAQQTLADATRATRTRMQEVALTLPPGSVVVPLDESIEAVLKAIELSERAATQVGVEIAAGHRAGTPPEERVAVRVLRAGTLAWWAALDGRDAGLAAMAAGTLELTLAESPADVDAIRHAVAMAEGRSAQEPISLPRPATAGGAP